MAWMQAHWPAVQPLGVPVTSDLDKALDDADGVIDFTAPQASLAFARITAAKHKIHIVGDHWLYTARRSPAENHRGKWRDHGALRQHEPWGQFGSQN